MSMQEKECNEMKKKITRRQMLHCRNCVCINFKGWQKKGGFSVQNEKNKKGVGSSANTMKKLLCT